MDGATNMGILETIQAFSWVLLTLIIYTSLYTITPPSNSSRYYVMKDEQVNIS